MDGNKQKEQFMKYIKSLAIVVLSCFILAGCSSVAHVEKDKTFNFGNLHTYSWPEIREGKADSAVVKVSDLTDRKIKEVVNMEMQKNGWKEVKHKPDVLMDYEVFYEKTFKRQNNPVYSQPYSRYYFNPYTRRWSSIFFPADLLGYDNGQRQVNEGTMTINMSDAQSDKTGWQGWTTTEVNSKNFTTKEIQNSVKLIFRKFDIAKN
ncbi:MAG: hypothetical protein NVS1B13_12590 [Flavisolibacter sp.]